MAKFLTVIMFLIGIGVVIIGLVYMIQSWKDKDQRKFYFYMMLIGGIQILFTYVFLYPTAFASAPV